jgi:hypothetical protein
MSEVTKYKIHLPDALVFVGVVILAGTAFFSPVAERVFVLAGGVLAGVGYLWARLVG